VRKSLLVYSGVDDNVGAFTAGSVEADGLFTAEPTTLSRPTT
jgi:hypothetical protein